MSKESICVSRLSGICDGYGCRDSKLRVIRKDLMIACKWPEKMMAEVPARSAVEGLNGAIVNRVPEIIQK